MEETLLREYMLKCIEIAHRAHAKEPGLVRRPWVGCLIIRDNGEIIGEGYKRIVPGTAMLMHAERVALDKAGKDARGATLITTLEPCISLSKNQVFDSCANMIIYSGIKRVVYGLLDSALPNSEMRRRKCFTENHVSLEQYEDLNEIILRELMTLKAQTDRYLSKHSS